MTYPNYPPQPPQYPPPAYPPAPGYPQSYPQQPAYPTQPQYPQQAPAPAQHFDIDDFYDQPAASGKSISSWFQTPGQSISGTVARAISKADVRVQTDMQTKQPLPPRPDGSYRTTMSIPLLVQPSPDFPDGRASWIVSPSDRPDLEMAMEAAGCPPKTVPEVGAVITITYLGPKQIPGFGAPKKVKQVTYQRPNGAVPNPTGQTPSATAAAPGPAPATSAAPATASYPQPGQPAPQYQQPPAYPQTMPGAFGQQVPAGAVPAPQYAPPPAAPAYGQDPYAPPAQPQYPVAPAQGMAPNGPGGAYVPQPVPPTPGAAAAAPGSMPGAPPTAPASPSNGYAVPGNLSPEQEARLRELTGQ